MSMTWLICLPFACLSAWLYHKGGTSDGTLWRDLGCSFVATLTLLILLLFKHITLTSWLFLSLFLSWGLLYGALTTYWKKKGEDARWWNWILTGLGYGLALLPYAFVSGLWLYFGIRTVVLAVSTMLWSEWQSNATWEELGRGFLIVTTLPICFI